MLFFLLRGTPRAVLLRAGLMIALIAFADWRVELNVTLGFLYLFPMLLVGSVLKRWQIVAVAAACAPSSRRSLIPTNGARPPA